MLTLKDFNNKEIKRINYFSKGMLFDSTSDANQDRFANTSVFNSVNSFRTRTRISNAENDLLTGYAIKLNYINSLESLYMGRYKELFKHEYENVKCYPAKPGYYQKKFANVVCMRKISEVDINGVQSYEYKYVCDIYYNNYKSVRELDIPKNPNLSVDICKYDYQLGYFETFMDNSGDNVVVVYKTNDEIVVKRVTADGTVSQIFNYNTVTLKRVKKSGNQLLIHFSTSDTRNKFIYINLDALSFSMSEGVVPDYIEHLNLIEITNGDVDGNLISIDGSFIYEFSINSGLLLNKYTYTDHFGTPLSTNSNTSMFADYKLNNIWVRLNSTMVYITKINYGIPSSFSRMSAADQLFVTQNKLVGTHYYINGSMSGSSITMNDAKRIGKIDNIQLLSVSPGTFARTTCSFVQNGLVTSGTVGVLPPLSVSPSTSTVTYKSKYFGETWTDHYTFTTNNALVMGPIIYNSGDIDNAYISISTFSPTSLSNILPRDVYKGFNGKELFLYDVNTIYINITKII